MRETVEDLLIRAKQLPFSEQLRLLEGLVFELRQTAPLKKELSWEDFIEYTAGILADDPIERPLQGEFEIRDSLE